MSIRFEVIHNGNKVALAGLDGNGVLCFGLTYIRREGEAEILRTNLGGNVSYMSDKNHFVIANWPTQEITIGDELTIRVLPPGEFDSPVVPAPTAGDMRFESCED